VAGLLVAAAACGGTGTDINQLVNANPSGDAAAEGGNPAPTSYQDPFAKAPPYSSSQQGGGGDDSHNSGQSCMQAGHCHGTQGSQGGEAPSFLIGGTVYQDYYGMMPATGVEVRILDTAGNAMSAYSDRGGNFYIRADQATAITFPAIVGARDSTSTRPMIRQLTSPAMGSCGQSPCHIPGGSPKTGVYFPIHVP
jgi:hypothetical protein